MSTIESYLTNGVSPSVEGSQWTDVPDRTKAAFLRLHSDYLRLLVQLDLGSAGDTPFYDDLKLATHSALERRVGQTRELRGLVVSDPGVDYGYVLEQAEYLERQANEL